MSEGSKTTEGGSEPISQALALCQELQRQCNTANKHGSDIDPAYLADWLENIMGHLRRAPSDGLAPVPYMDASAVAMASLSAYMEGAKELCEDGNKPPDSIILHHWHNSDSKRRLGPIPPPREPEKETT